jgi:hypothetical protein
MEGVDAMSFRDLFEDQKAFNQLIFNKKKNEKNELAIIDRLKELTFGMIEESVEFIRTYDFKVHRRSSRLQNIAHSHEELIDMLKYWLSLVDATDFPLDKLEEMYYAKSRVVQYRYQEEWMKTIDRPSVVVDIDEVLADYLSGICRWGINYGPQIMKLSPPDTLRLVHTLETIQRGRQWINSEAVGLPQVEWQKVKHDFRVRGGKRFLPVFPDARPFLEWCRAQGWIILLITSRPIDRYPNIFTDKLTWLDTNGLPFDHLWWTNEKTQRLEEAHIVLRSQIKFAVDDNLTFVHQFAQKGVRTYWLTRDRIVNLPGVNQSNIIRVSSLTELMEQETHHHATV